MGIARSLSETLGNDDESGKREKLSESMPIGELDPKMIGLMTKLIKEYNTKKHDKTALLTAMKPYVKSENRAALDKAGSILKMTQLAKIAFSELGGEKNE